MQDECPSVRSREAEGAPTLLRAAALAESLGAPRDAEEARELAGRVTDGRFYVACVGQFKRGKSTLINALVGLPVLPTGLIPVTAVVTVVRFGRQPAARVRTIDGAWRQIAVSELKEYVSEDYNAANVKRVSLAEVSVPAEVLAGGLCLVDTPGLGSAVAAGAQATHAFVPHIDAALIVAGADPPLGGEELDLVEAVSQQARDLILVLNKADRTSQADGVATAAYARKLVEERLHRPVGPVLEISATERLQNAGPGRDWEKLLAALNRLTRDSGQDLVRASMQRGLKRLRERLLAMIREERQSLLRPIAESEKRVAALKETATAAEGSMGALTAFTNGEQGRLSDKFLARREEFVTAALPQALSEFQSACDSRLRGMGPAYRRALMREAQEIAGRCVLPWLQAEQPQAEEQYRNSMRRVVSAANEFLGRLDELAVSEPALLPHAIEEDTGFRVPSRFQFEELIGVARPASPLRWLADWALTLAGGRGVIRREACEFLERLVETNSTRIQNDLLSRMQDSRGRLEAEIRTLLHEVSVIAERALVRARGTLAEGSAAVEANLKRLEHLELEVRTLEES